VVVVDGLPPVTTVADATLVDAPLVFDEAGTNVWYRKSFTYGEPEEAFARALADGGTVVSETFRQHRVANAPLEGHVGLAAYDPGTGELVYRTANQNPHALRHHLAAILGLGAHRVRVVCGDIGGSFGQKAYPHREDVVVCAASRLVGRPVKWIAERRENLLAGGHAREDVVDVDLALSRDGDLVAARVRMTVDVGAYPLVTLPATSFAMMARALFPSAYRLAHMEFESVVVGTNKATYVPYRGPWAAETFARERLLDIVARRQGRDRVQYRLDNLWADDELPRPMATGPDLVGITLRRTLLDAVDRIDRPGFLRLQEAARRDGRWLGLGVCCSIEASPGPANFGLALGAGASPRGHQQADARLETDGTVSISTSQQPHGQGHETTLAQLAAAELGVGLDQVRVVHGDTSATPFNMVGTGGSRAATMASGAVIGVARALRALIIDIAAHRVEADQGDLECRGGTVLVRGVPARSLSFAEIARIAYFRRGELPPGLPPRVEATFDFTPAGGGWTQATHACTVEVDAETGRIHVLRFVTVLDVGSVVNPSIVAGQVHGGVVQGLGEVLLESASYGRDGQPQATTFLDYLLPSASDVPPVEVFHLFGPSQAEIDFRGVGECGAVGAPAALVNAVEDALSPLGVRITGQLLSPERVRALVERAAPRAGD
jgi:aerobic carbon-monoxide dehydrogenase large subunit